MLFWCLLVLGIRSKMLSTLHGGSRLNLDARSHLYEHLQFNK